MGQEYRAATTIHLHESNVELSVGSEGIWSQYEFQRWDINGESIRGWLEALGFDVESVVVPRYEKGKRVGGSRANVEDAHPLTIEKPIRTASSSNSQDLYEVDWKFKTIEARVVAPNLLDIRFTVDGGEDTVDTLEVTYSGSFTILWARAEG